MALTVGCLYCWEGLRRQDQSRVALAEPVIHASDVRCLTKTSLVHSTNVVPAGVETGAVGGRVLYLNRRCTRPIEVWGIARQGDSLIFCRVAIFPTVGLRRSQLGKLVIVVFAIAAVARTEVIDFGKWSDANGLNTFTIGKTTVTANIGRLNITSYGVGISSETGDYLTNEINGLEVARVEFSSPVIVSQLVFQSLMPNQQGEYRTNEGSWVVFSGLAYSGQLTMDVSFGGVKSLEFRPANPSGLNISDDFALNSITTVPEPSTFVLNALLLAIIFSCHRQIGRAFRQKYHI